MNNNWIAAVLLVVTLMTLWSCSDNSVTTFNADVMGCSEYTQDKKKCIWSDVQGIYKVSLSKNVNSCAILYKKSGQTEQVLIKGRYLTYIDNDNWQCTSEQYPLERLVHQVKMQDGYLMISIISLDSATPQTNEYIEETDGIVGKITHWYRLVHGTPCIGHLSEHSVCDVVSH